MENGAAAAYPPQAHLSAAFQAASAAGAATTMAGSTVSHFQEALMSRMGRPFGLTGADMKDLAASSPFAAASLGLAAAGRAATGAPGSIEGFPGLPFLSHMAAAAGAAQPPFLHHFVDPRHPFTAGAFRPFMAATTAVTSLTESGKPSFTSAFQPPTSKGDRKGSPTLFSPGQNLFPRNGSAGSPGSPSSSPPTSHSSSSLGKTKMDENSNTNLAQHHPGLIDVRHADSVSPVSMDSNHTDEERSAKKLRLSSDYGCVCPICGLPLRTSELESHYTQELEYLAKLSAAVLLNQKQQGFKSPVSFEGTPYMKQMSPRGGSIEVAPRSRWDTFQRIQRNRQSRIRVKLSRRAAKRNDEVLEEEEEISQKKPDDEDIDIVGDGGAKGNNNNTSLSSDASTTSRDIQTHVYGPPQFTEADVLACVKENGGTEEENNDGMVKKEMEEDGKEKEVKEETMEEEEKSPESVELLKAKLKEMEENNKCSKCMKTLKDPVVNVGCWHIQCEKCWLLSLGSPTKTCSLCGVASSPSDLRKVFL